jgi:hypothetical protein
MKTFKITAIEFDFGDDYDEGWEGDPVPQEEIIRNVMNCDWEIEDEEDLVDEITNETGWCIKSIDYCEIQ